VFSLRFLVFEQIFLAGGHTMPFLRVDAYEGRSKKQVKELLDAIHRAILSAFGVPLRDRYQVYQEHSESNFIVQDTGLGIDRTKNVVFIGITSRQRTEVQKTMLYTKLVEELKTYGIEQNDIVVSIVTNLDADWSFANGRAQFLTGEL
jgi:DNA helicase TIP49 (TBP-interacting protein)